MDDQTTTLAQVKERVRAFSTERSWTGEYTPKNLSMAIAAEAAELMEHFLWDEGRLEDPGELAAVRDELADILIYVMEFASATGTDLAGAVAQKMAKNARRFPAS
jgi:dCTP diphosphatase